MTERPEETADVRRPARRPSTKKRRRQTVLAIGGLVLAVAAVAFAGWTLRSGGSGTPKYTTSQVTKGTLVVAVTASGNMVVTDEQQVQPAVSGTIDDVSVKLGQKVKTGDVLYTVSNDDLDGSVSRARASYRNAEQSLERAKISKLEAEQRLDQLESDTGTRTAPTATDISIAKRQITAAKKGVSAAEDNLDAASDDLANAKENAEARTVKAPMDGLVTALTVTTGRSTGSTSGSSSGSSGSSGSGSSADARDSSSSSSSSGSSSSGTNGSVTISDLGSMVARVQVNEVDLPDVKAGQKATLTFDAIDGLTLTGKVVKVAITGSSSSGVVTYDVDIKTDTLDERIKPNMSVSASITTQVRKDVILAPNTAVKSDTNGSYVQVLGTDGTAQRVEVTTGASNDTETEVTEGLTEGQDVVTGNVGAAGTGSSSSGGQRSGGFMMGPGMGGGARVRGN